MQPFLANPALQADEAAITGSVEHMRTMLAIRNSFSLFRLQTETDVMQRLAFHNTGPDQIPGLIVMSLSDLVEPDLDGDHEFIVVVFNANDEAQTITVDATAGLGLGVHPLQAGLAASFDDATGTFSVPARTTAVFVDGGATPVENVVQNGSFETGEEPWRFYSNGRGTFRITDDATAGDRAARIRIDAVGSNVQLYQRDLVLKPNTQYSLRFDAKSNNGQDMSLFVHQHGAPYTNYGARAARVDLTTAYQTYFWEFTTANFDEMVEDGRLRFWLAPYAKAGDVYIIDHVSLQEKGTAMAFDTEATAAASVSSVLVIDDEAGLLAGGVAVDELDQQLFIPFVAK
ncbi:MAG: alpha-1,6-glucosidase domain-containing protein [Caldilineaceae bacterium]